MSNWKLKKIGKHIFIHYFIMFFGEPSNVNIKRYKCAAMPLFLVLCTGIRG